MAAPDKTPFTLLLQRASQGDREASARMLPIIYDSLKASARRQMRVCGRETLLDTTGLVHEAWVGLMDRNNNAVEWQDRAHFLRYSARAMRNVLIDQLRAAGAEKRGGQLIRVELDENEPELQLDAESMLALDQALERLADISSRLVEVVELRFFAGLDVHETARVMDIAPRTVIREWRKARLLLKEMMHEPPD